MNLNYMRALNLAITDALLSAIRAMSTSASIPQILAHKGSEGYAPRLGAGGIDTTSSKDEDLSPALNEEGASHAIHKFILRSIA